MRKFLLTLALMLIGILSYAQSIKDSFMGMTFGDKISAEIVQSALGSDAVLTKATDMYFEFAGVSYLGIDWTTVIIRFDNERIFRSISFSKSFSTLEQTKTFFNEFKSSIPYELEPSAFIDDAFGLFADNGEVLYSMNDEQPSVSLSYFSQGYLAGLLGDLIDDITETKPTLQTSFFGLEIGSKVNESSVVKAVGNRGVYRNKEKETNQVVYDFSKLSFAGYTWDVGLFITLDDGTLMEYIVYTSFDDNSWDVDQKKDAEQLYSKVQTSLRNKYGEGLESDKEGSKEITYYGENSMALRLSNERLKSKGGEYRRYIQLTYVNIDLLNKLNAKNEDEF